MFIFLRLEGRETLRLEDASVGNGLVTERGKG